MKLEPYQDSDFTAFVELLNAVAAELGGQATDEAAQLEYEGWLKRDLSKQRVIIRDPEDPSRLVGYADFFIVEDSAEANLALGVLSDFWGQGREHDLLNWLISQVELLNVKVLNLYAPGKASDLQLFVEAQGFEQKGAYRLLVLEPVSRPQFALPTGYRLETLATIDDTAPFIEASRRSFADLWGHGVAKEEIWQTVRELYGPRNLYLLLFKDAPVGCFRVRVMEDEGYIDSPGLAPEHRSAELYRTLTLAGLQRLAAEGVKRVSVETWGEPEETIDAYESLGFELDAVELGYQRKLEE